MIITYYLYTMRNATSQDLVRVWDFICEENGNAIIIDGNAGSYSIAEIVSLQNIFEENISFIAEDGGLRMHLNLTPRVAGNYLVKYIRLNTEVNEYLVETGYTNTDILKEIMPELMLTKRTLEDIYQEFIQGKSLESLADMQGDSEYMLISENV